MPKGVYIRKNKKITLICCECGQEFLVDKYRTKDNRTKYCSKKCFGYGHGKVISGNNNPLFGVRKYGKDNPNFKGGSELFKKRQRDKFNSNIHLRLRYNVSNMIWKRLKRRLLSKGGNSIIKFLPYTINDLINHLESKFDLWMTWDNYGNKDGCWSIDHIIPDSSFNYKSVEDEEFKRCWSLKNLQPMEHIENIKKGNKII